MVKIMVPIYFGAILVLFLNINETPIKYKFLSFDVASHTEDIWAYNTSNEISRQLAYMCVVNY